MIVKQPSQECVASKGEEEPQDEFLKLLTTQQKQENQINLRRGKKERNSQNRKKAETSEEQE